MESTVAQPGTTAPSNRIARPGASRSVLKAKAANQALPADDGTALEDMFPGQGQDKPAGQPAPSAKASAGTMPAPLPGAVKPQAKADNLLTIGAIQPNPDTVPAVIVAIVQQRGNMSRADLVAAMADAVFKHPKAKPADKGWCAGYLAGCLRNGFLAVATERAPADQITLGGIS